MLPTSRPKLSGKKIISCPFFSLQERNVSSRGRFVLLVKSYTESWLIKPLISNLDYQSLIHHADELSNTFIYFCVEENWIIAHQSWTGSERLFCRTSHVKEEKTWRKSPHWRKVRQWIKSTVEMRSWCSNPPRPCLWTQGQIQRKDVGLAVV